MYHNYTSLSLKETTKERFEEVKPMEDMSHDTTLQLMITAFELYMNGEVEFEEIEDGILEAQVNGDYQ